MASLLRASSPSSVSAPAPALRGLSPSESTPETMSDPSHRDVLARLPKIKCIFSDLDGTLCHFDRSAPADAPADTPLLFLALCSVAPQPLCAYTHKYTHTHTLGLALGSCRCTHGLARASTPAPHASLPVLFTFGCRHTTHFGVEIETDEAMARAVVRNKEGEERECSLLPTSTMGNGVISDRTLELVRGLRERGVKFVMISGARTTTMFARLPRLPNCDAIACETGVKILYPPCEDGDGESSSVPVAMQSPPTTDPYAHRAVNGELLSLDRQWSAAFENVTGPLDSSLAPLERLGSLWDLYRELSDLGLEPDARGYYGCFRVNCRGDDGKLALLRPFLEEATLSARGIAHAMNLGMFDFFPALAGKGPAVQFLQAKWGFKAEECIALFDDDNDLKMVDQCGVGMLPGITSESVKQRLDSEPSWALARGSGTGVFATEELLQAILDEVTERARVLKDDSVSP